MKYSERMDEFRIPLESLNFRHRKKRYRNARRWSHKSRKTGTGDSLNRALDEKLVLSLRQNEKLHTWDLGFSRRWRSWCSGLCRHLQPRRWRECSPKRWYLPTISHDVTTQKNIVIIKIMFECMSNCFFSGRLKGGFTLWDRTWSGHFRPNIKTVLPIGILWRGQEGFILFGQVPVRSRTGYLASLKQATFVPCPKSSPFPSAARKPKAAWLGGWLCGYTACCFTEFLRNLWYYVWNSPS
jgi:hypothetical protein